MLRPEITYLNFGAYGSCPAPVFENYQNWQLELEREPAQFIGFNGPSYLKKSREALAAFINCNADDIVYVSNPSYAINIIAKSLILNKGDEVLSTNLEYGALDRTWNFYCSKAGAVYRRQSIELPLVSKDQFISDFYKGLSEKTKVVFLGQITSATALIFPVKEICEIARAKGLMTIIDGAHVPGHIPLDISALKPDIYTGTCHKWMCTPKGCSFLYVKKELQDLFDPLVISWGYQARYPSASQFLDYHQMQGTRDFSAFLTVPKAIGFMKENQWDKVAADCRGLAHKNYERFCALMNSKPLCPVSDEFLGQMCSIPVSTHKPEQLQRHLFEKYNIEIPVMKQDDQIYIRYSIQGFNSQEDLDKLYRALNDIILNTDLLVKYSMTQ